MWFNKIIISDVSGELYSSCSFNGFSNELNIGYRSVIFFYKVQIGFLK